MGNFFVNLLHTFEIKKNYYWNTISFPLNGTATQKALHTDTNSELKTPKLKENIEESKNFFTP